MPNEAQVHLQAKFVKSSSSLEGCPLPDKPEFAFIGRSNVGKSSLINFLTAKKDLALTSSQPGKTRLINHFIINDSWYLVDLPGYGYAKTSKTDRDKWMIATQEYLAERENLVTVFLLIDASITPQKIDLEFAQWLGENAVPFAIVFTKADKKKAREVNFNIRAFQTEMLKSWEELPPVFISSALKPRGREDILRYIQTMLEMGQ